MVNNANTLRRVQELRVDALYEKKKHYNAADRKDLCHRALGLPAIVINVLLGSVLFAYLSDSCLCGHVVKWIGATLALLAAVLGGFQTFFNYGGIIQGHRSVASEFLYIAKECSRIEAYVLDGNMNPEVLHGQLERLAGKYHQIVKDAEAFPTNEDDFRKARGGFEQGEEEYTANELAHRGE